MKLIDYKIQQYEILQYSTPEELESNVMLYLKDGWQLYGSPFSIVETKHPGYDQDSYDVHSVCQAMVKYGL